MTLDYSFTWDWKEQPNWNKIADAINELNETTRDKVRFYDIETNADEYGLVISANEYDETEAFQTWERGRYGNSEDSNCTIDSVSGWLLFKDHKHLFNDEAKKNCRIKFADGSECNYNDEHPMEIMTHFKLACR